MLHSLFVDRITAWGGVCVIANGSEVTTDWWPGVLLVAVIVAFVWWRHHHVSRRGGRGSDEVS